jgi:GH15 family glucan-1,4-alpha-glucosidase
MMFCADDTHAEYISATLQTIEQELLDKTASGGVVRFEYDSYFRASPDGLGNPWPVATLWLAQYYIRTGQLDRAKKYMEWTVARAAHSGMISEQVDPNTGYAVGVSPLVWSHAELINTMLDYYKVKP